MIKKINLFFVLLFISGSFIFCTPDKNDEPVSSCHEEKSDQRDPDQRYEVEVYIYCNGARRELWVKKSDSPSARSMTLEEAPPGYRGPVGDGR